MNFGVRVRTLRIERGLSQENLANLVGKSKGTISKIENNKRTPDFPLIERLAKALKIPRNDLFPVNESITPHEMDILSAYRKQSIEVQAIVDRILGIDLITN